MYKQYNCCHSNPLQFSSHLLSPRIPQHRIDHSFMTGFISLDAFWWDKPTKKKKKKQVLQCSWQSFKIIKPAQNKSGDMNLV